MFEQELLNKIKPGQTWRLNYGPGNPNNNLLHVRAIVDDKFVLRYWSKRGFHWVYGVESIYFFSVGIESGHLRQVKNQKSGPKARAR